MPLIPVIFFIFIFFDCGSLGLKKPEIRAERFVYFSAVGDVMVHSTQLDSAYNKKCKCWDFEPVFSEVRDSFRDSDLNFCNLETTLPGDKTKYSGDLLFGTPDSIVKALKNTGFNIINTANNHSVDKGSLGIDHTIQVLDDHNLWHIGTYFSFENYKKNRILMIKKNDILFAFLSYTYGINGIQIPKGKIVNLIDKKVISEDISIARKKKADVIVAYFHFGVEYQREPNFFQKEIVSFAFREGADIVLASHPHVLQPYEFKMIRDKYGKAKKRLVIYSLGNFISAQHRRYRDGGIIFNFCLKKTIYKMSSQIHIENIRIIPVWVYLHKVKKEKKYYLIPVEKYLKNDRELKMTQNAHQRMLQFYNDTNTHFKEYSAVEESY